MAYDFTTASNHYLSVSDNAALDITGGLSICAWAKSSGSYGTNRGIVSKWVGTGNQRSYAILINSTGSPQFLLSATGAFESANNLTATNAIGTNWSHVAAVLNPSTRQELFINAVSAAVKTSSVISGAFSSSADLEIGRFFADNSNRWDGQIAEVGIWSTNLSAAEIASLAKGMSCDKVRPQNLVAYFPLVRDLIEYSGGLTVTNNNTATVAAHPRVYA